MGSLYCKHRGRRQWAGGRSSRKIPMTLYTDSRIAMQAAAFTPAAIATSTGSPSVAEILLRPWRRMRILRELQGLDERMLRDIGVTRPELDQVAADAAGGDDWI